MEVEVREEASARNAAGDAALNDSLPTSLDEQQQPVVIVRVEEVLLVVLVLMIWVAAIALFFNRWGKIRMLEPYQPKFNQQSHRPSCPLAPLSPAVPQVSSATFPRTQKPTTQRMSFSKYNVNAMTDPLSALPSPIIRRPRQNSVFVGGSSALLNTPPRRVKSAIDIQHMLINEQHHTIPISFSTSGSVVPILNRDRRPSITIERSRLHRPSITTIPSCARRSSCFADQRRPQHRNFISFEHPKPLRMEMKPSCSYQQQPTISFDSYVASNRINQSTSMEIRDAAAAPPIRIPKVSRSFEQPSTSKIKAEPRLVNSFDVVIQEPLFETRRCSIAEEEPNNSSEQVYICLDETRITAPLLEGLKSSDV